MATVRRRGAKWQAIVDKNGVFKSATFSSKPQAEAWATLLEAEIISGKATGIVPNKTFGDLLERYRDEVSASKAGAVFESRRINHILRSDLKVDGSKISFADLKLSDIGPRHISAWRDARLKAGLSTETVRREWTILNSAFNTAINEWQWMSVNPMKGVKRPEKGQPRDRLATDEELDALCVASGYTVGEQPATLTAKAAACFLFCSEAGLRKGELLALDWRDVYLDRRFLHVEKGKTAAATRDVPLSPRALQILADLGPKRKGPVVEMEDTQLDALFRKIVNRAGIEDLHFHDSRHTAVTRLAGKLNVIALARAIGHRDLRMLQVYYNEKAEDLAALL